MLLNKPKCNVLLIFSYQLFCLTPATTTLCGTIHGEPSIIHMLQLQTKSVTEISPGAAGIGSSLTTRVLTSQTRVFLSTAVGLISLCGFVVDTQELRMESSLEMSAVTGIITAVISDLTPLKSKPVQAIIMSMSWLVNWLFSILCR